MIKRIKNKYLLMCVTATVAVSSVAAPVMAADTSKPDYSQVTGSVDFGDVAIGVMAIAAAIAGLYVCITGVKKLTGFLRSA